MCGFSKTLTEIVPSWFRCMSVSRKGMVEVSSFSMVNFVFGCRLLMCWRNCSRMQHISAVRKADTRQYETADHVWKFNHDFNWRENKILGHELNTTTRKIKETIHSIKTENCINGISYKLPDIWLPSNKGQTWWINSIRKQPPKFTKQSPLGSAIPKARQKLPFVSA